MKMPWEGKSGLAKPTTIFATVLLVSLGLCGTNLIVTNVGAIQNSGDATTVLIVTGFIELAGIVAGIIGLATVAVLAVAKTIWKDPDPPSKKERAE